MADAPPNPNEKFVPPARQKPASMATYKRILRKEIRKRAAEPSPKSTSSTSRR
jgi:hypothetical protein